MMETLLMVTGAVVLSAVAIVLVLSLFGLAEVKIDVQWKK